jgi:hypothetical protein
VKVFLIYRCGAADAQRVGRHLSIALRYLYTAIHDELINICLVDVPSCFVALPDTPMKNFFDRTTPSLQEENVRFRDFFIFISIFLAVILGTLFFVRPSFTLIGAVSRGGRVIAIDYSEDPQNRIIFSTPITYLNGITKPPDISYGLADVSKARSLTDYQHMSLNEQEWQFVDQWRQRWCQTAPKFRKIQPQSGEPFYTVALRCADSNLSDSNVKIFTVPVAQLPEAIRTIIGQVSNRRYG